MNNFIFLALSFLFLLPQTGLTSDCRQDIESVNIQGKEALLLRNDYSSIFRIRITFLGQGYMTDGRDKAGLASITSSLISGCELMDNGKEFCDQLTSEGFRIITSVDSDNFYVYALSLSGNASKLAKTIKKMLIADNLTKEALKIAKNRAISEINLYSEQPAFWAKSMLGYNGFINNLRSIEEKGRRETIEKISRKDVIEKTRSAINRNSAIITATGAIGSSELIDFVNEVFSESPLNPQNEEFYQQKEGIKNGGRVFISNFSSPQAMVLFAGNMPKNTPETEKEYMAAHIAAVTAGLSLDSPLSKKLRVDNGLVYQFGLFPVNTVNFNYLYGNMASRDPKKAIDILQKEMNRISDNGIDKKLIDKKISSIVSSMLLRCSSPAEMIYEINEAQSNGLSLNYIKNKISMIKSINNSDVNEAAKKYLAPENFVFVSTKSSN